MPENIEQEVLAAEDRLTSATRTLDIATLEGIYSDEILMTNVLGETCSKSSLIDEATRGIADRQRAAAAGKAFEGSYDKEDLKVVTHGDTAVAAYRFVVRIKGPGIDVRRRYRTTNAWVKRDGRWQIVAAHTAFVLDPRQAASLESASSAGVP